MHKEELLEDGIIISSEKGIAEIGLIENSECEECSAKLFCKSGEDKTKTIKAHDPFNGQPGDKVRISIPGNAVLKATIVLYGIPLIILLVSIWIGMFVLSQSAQPELFSFLAAIGMMGVYFTAIYLWSQKHKEEFRFAKVISVNKHF